MVKFWRAIAALLLLVGGLSVTGGAACCDDVTAPINFKLILIGLVISGMGYLLWKVMSPIAVGRRYIRYLKQIGALVHEPVVDWYDAMPVTPEEARRRKVIIVE